MEPSVAVNYLSTVRQSARYVYLREKMDGKELAKKWSEGGVLQQTKLNHYANALEGYQMVDYSQAYMLDFADVYYASYYDCIWAR
jgi:hypothetical protein